MSDVAIGSQPWYRSLNRSQWNTLIASNLGWLFDGYETYALVISVGVALRQLLDPSQYSQIPVYAGTVIAFTLLGWGIGGLIGGVIADYIGRKRTMMLAILAYSLMTGLSAFAWDWRSFAVMRFLVGVCIGSEWVTGTSIVAELWPDKNRGKGVGLMQTGFGIGFFLASVAWFFINPMGPDAWRVMFLLGVVPALLTLVDPAGHPGIRQMGARQRAAQRRDRARAQRRHLDRAGAGAGALHRRRPVRRAANPAARDPRLPDVAGHHVRLLGHLGLAAALRGRRLAAKAGLPPQQWASYAAMANNGAAIIGYAAFGFLADAYGRKPVTIAYVVLAFLSVPIVFLWTHDLTFILIAAAFSGSVRVRPVHLDGVLAAGAVPDPGARHRHGLRVQHAAPDRLDRAADLRLADRQFRRLQHRRGGDRLRLYPQPRGGAVPAGDAGQAAAGVGAIAHWRFLGLGLTFAA